MRLACGLAIAFCLSFPAAGKGSRQQDAAGSANSAGQTPAPPTAPAEQAAAPTRPAAGQKAQEGVAQEKEKTEATAASTGAASGTPKRRKHTVPVPTPVPTPEGAPRKIVVRQGGAREPAAQIAPGMTPAEATRQRQNAEQLLSATDDQLKQLAGRTLDAREQETAGQIRNYMVGARSALKEGDLRRASTLAEKAHLLADDIVKH
ncbi:MAG TPA: hypothetical protein VKH18_13155 [Terriglobales bacterium]|nr:hypothetical protein [Terriglobales bacterium]